MSPAAKSEEKRMLSQARLQMAYCLSQVTGMGQQAGWVLDQMYRSQLREHYIEMQWHGKEKKYKKKHLHVPPYSHTSVIVWLNTLSRSNITYLRAMVSQNQ